MTLFDAVELCPLAKEANALEGLGCAFGALHIILEDGNYEDHHIQYCIDYVESGAYQREKHATDPALTERQLAFARNLLPLTPEYREMVCENKCITEELFEHIHNEHKDPR